MVGLWGFKQNSETEEREGEGERERERKQVQVLKKDEGSAPEDLRARERERERERSVTPKDLKVQANVSSFAFVKTFVRSGQILAFSGFGFSLL